MKLDMFFFFFNVYVSVLYFVSFYFVLLFRRTSYYTFYVLACFYTLSIYLDVYYVDPFYSAKQFSIFLKDTAAFPTFLEM